MGALRDYLCTTSDSLKLLYFPYCPSIIHEMINNVQARTKRAQCVVHFCRCRYGWGCLMALSGVDVDGDRAVQRSASVMIWRGGKRWWDCNRGKRVEAGDCKSLIRSVLVCSPSSESPSPGSTSLSSSCIMAQPSQPEPEPRRCIYNVPLALEQPLQPLHAKHRNLEMVETSQA